jgi:hypothetical protein
MNDKVLKATHSGKLFIGNTEIPCHVLENGERILSTRGIMKSLGRTWRGRKYSGTQLPVFLEAKNLKTYISDDLATVLAPIIFKPKTGYSSEGYKAEILPIVCDIYLKARDDGTLTPQQETIAKSCDILVRALSKVGIIALVDEATGYQEVREKDELQKILAAYISAELLPWTRRFPIEFYKEMFRLKNWPYPFYLGKGVPKGPRYAGKLTKQLIYEKLPPGVLQELERKNPPNEKWQRKHRHHQWLTENIGNPHLEKQVAVVTTLMKVSPNWKVFERNFRRAFPQGPEQMKWIEEEE